MDKDIILSELKEKYGYDIIEDICIGNFSTIKLKASKNNNKFFIKIKDYNCAEKILEGVKIYNSIGIDTPEIIEQGVLLDNKYFFDAYAFINGYNLKNYLDNHLSSDIVKGFGYNAGYCARLLKEYRNINTSIFHPVTIQDKINYIRPLFEKFFNSNILNLESDIYNKFLSGLKPSLDNYEKYFINDSMNLIHNDIKPANFILSNNKLYIIDIEGIEYSYNIFDLEFFIQHILWDYDFSINWIKGYIEGLYNNIPDFVLQQLKYSFIHGFLITIDYYFNFLNNELESYLKLCYDNIFNKGIDLFFDKMADDLSK